MKNLKKQKNPEHKDFKFNDEDIALLAFMCLMCRPLVTKKCGIFARTYAYYVPDENEYLDIARGLFKKNGVNARVHFSYIVDSLGRDVLRINYRYSRNPERDNEFFEKIKLKKREIFYNDAKEEDAKRLAQQVMSLVNQNSK